ncbi:hypothetical protein [Saezia sanguinis]|uniref:hypothetical protein n=1 Tax=Saezia sanguinis TaxID=1965230 RepID=UPI003065248A
MTTVDEMFNRERQLEILSTLVSFFPDPVPNPQKIFSDIDDVTITRELSYLEGHGLVKTHFRQINLPKLSHLKQIVGVTITSKGIDFLKDDGGLGAILNVVTVKFHDDVIKLLSEKISNSPEIPQQDKKKFLDQLRSLPSDAIKHLVMKLLDKGLENIPQLLQLLQSLPN